MASQARKSFLTKEDDPELYEFMELNYPLFMEEKSTASDNAVQHQPVAETAQAPNRGKKRKQPKENRETDRAKRTKWMHLLTEELLTNKDDIKCNTRKGHNITIKSVRSLYREGQMLTDEALYLALKEMCPNATVIDSVYDEEARIAAIKENLKRDPIIVPLYYEKENFKHFVLLYIRKRKDITKAYFADSLFPDGGSPCQEMAEKIVKGLDLGKNIEFKIVGCRKQESTDNNCGVHVIRNAELIYHQKHLMLDTVMDKERKKYSNSILFGTFREAKKVKKPDLVQVDYSYSPLPIVFAKSKD